MDYHVGRSSMAVQGEDKACTLVSCRIDESYCDDICMSCRSRFGFCTSVFEVFSIGSILNVAFRDQMPKRFRRKWEICFLLVTDRKHSPQRDGNEVETR